MAPHALARLALVLLALSACGSMSAARRAFEQGSFSQAERLADLRLREHPDDAEARELRQQAREKVPGKHLADAQAARARGDTDGALAFLGQLLARQRTWELRLSGAQAAALAGELEQARGAIRGEVTPLLARGRGLAAPRPTR